MFFDQIKVVEFGSTLDNDGILDRDRLATGHLQSQVRAVVKDHKVQ